MIELKIKIKQEYEKGNFKGLDLNVQKIEKNCTIAEEVVCESLEKGIEYTIDAIMEQTAEKMEEIKKGCESYGRKKNANIRRKNK